MPVYESETITRDNPNTLRLDALIERYQALKYSISCLELHKSFCSQVIIEIFKKCGITRFEDSKRTLVVLSQSNIISITTLPKRVRKNANLRK